MNIKFFSSYEDDIKFEDYKIAMLENVRFNSGEKSCDSNLSKAYASLADHFVFDAFGVSHRKECTTYGVSDYLKTHAGHNISNEITTINKLINENSKPMTIIISGAKVSTKLIVIKKLLDKYSEPNPAALIESALDNIKILEDNDFFNFKISVKSSDIFMAIKA